MLFAHIPKCLSSHCVTADFLLIILVSSFSQFLLLEWNGSDDHFDRTMLTTMTRSSKGRPSSLWKMGMIIMTMVYVVLGFQVNVASSSPYTVASRTLSYSSSSSIDMTNTFHFPPTSSSRSPCPQLFSKICHRYPSIVTIRGRRSLPLSTLSSNVLTVRGGGGSICVSNTVGVFADWVASSKGRSWTVLFTSIMLDTLSTALMKHARETSSATKICLAFLGYFLRYGTLVY